MRIAALAVIFASCLFAQRGGNPVSPSGFGRIMFPGGGPQGAYTGSSVANPVANPYGSVLFPGAGAPAQIYNPIAGGGYPVATPPIVRHDGHRQSVVVPYPVFVGGGYYPYQAPLAYGYGGIGQAWPTPGQPGFAGLPAYGSANYVQPTYLPSEPSTSTSQEQSPVVVINQYFRPDAPPTTQTFNAPGTSLATTPQPEAQSASASQDTQNIFLIAMKDHTIYAASSYWIEDNMLNYITVQGMENSVSLDLVDRDLSRRLNRDRKVAFGLPNN
jgi:hypothetical protein